MNRKSIYLKLLSVLLCTTLLYSCKSQSTSTPAATSTTADINVATSISKLVTYKANDYYTDWKNESPNYIKLNGTGATLEGVGANVTDSKITINKAGVYVISGKLDNGQIIVDAQDKGIVKLVLNGAEINSVDNAAIYVKAAGKLLSVCKKGQRILLMMEQNTWLLMLPQMNLVQQSIAKMTLL